jgi:hypothetical protein
MLEVSMSVWPVTAPVVPLLSGSEGALVSISIHVDPRFLESLLEALAQAPFPVNPQIYHDAAIVCCYADGHEEAEETTLVEFPAYAARVDELRGSLQAYGFDPASAHVTGMLEEIQGARVSEPAPAGAAYVSRYRVKRRPVAAG